MNRYPGRPFRSAIGLFMFLILFSTSANGLDLWSERILLTDDVQLREKILTRHMVSRDPLSAH